jgi:hypothetical protein
LGLNFLKIEKVSKISHFDWGPYLLALLAKGPFGILRGLRDLMSTPFILIGVKLFENRKS